MPRSRRSLSAVAHYDSRADLLAERYESLPFERVHADILEVLPPPPATILDVGAGSGRDAAAMATMGYLVVAVEPSVGLRTIAKQLHPNSPVTWIDDALPTLPVVRSMHRSFDFILLSAVWMHVPPEQRPEAMEVLSALLAPAGRLAVTLRLGPPDVAKGLYPVDESEISFLAQRCRLKELKRRSSTDLFGRTDIHWMTIVLEAQWTPAQATLTQATS